MKKMSYAFYDSFMKFPNIKNKNKCSRQHQPKLSNASVLICAEKQLCLLVML